MKKLTNIITKPEPLTAHMQKASSIFTGCEKKDPTNNLVVIVKYKTQQNKSVDAIIGLKKLIEEVKKEDHFVNLKLHVDQKDNSNILLYEEWDDPLFSTLV